MKGFLDKAKAKANELKDKMNSMDKQAKNAGDPRPSDKIDNHDHGADLPSINIPPFRDWLASINLSAYADKMVSNGYDDLETVAMMSDDEIKGMLDIIQALPGHKIRFQHKIHELKAQRNCKEGGNAAQDEQPGKVADGNVQGEKEQEEKKQDQGEQLEQVQKPIVEQIRELSHANLPPPGSSTAQVLFHYTQIAMKHIAKMGFTETPILVNIVQNPDYRQPCARVPTIRPNPSKLLVMGDGQTVHCVRRIRIGYHAADQQHHDIIEEYYKSQTCTGMHELGTVFVFDVSQACALELKTPRVFLELVHLFSANELQIRIQMAEPSGDRTFMYDVLKPAEMKEGEFEAMWIDKFNGQRGVSWGDMFFMTISV